MNDRALIDRMVRIDDLRRGESEEWVDGDEDDADGIAMNGTSPLKMMIGADEERWSNISFPKGGEGAIIGLMD